MHHTQSTDTIHSDNVRSARPLARSSSVAPVLEADLSLLDSCNCSTITSNSLSDLRFQSFDFTSHYLSNQQYSITAVTTSSGSVAERYAYTAYGQPTFLDASGTPLTTQTSILNARYLYTGREWDATLGLYHFRARWMSGVAGRFLTRDPIGIEGSPYGLSESLGSSPLVYTDWSGLWIVEKRTICEYRLLSTEIDITNTPEDCTAEFEVSRTCRMGTRNNYNRPNWNDGWHYESVTRFSDITIYPVRIDPEYCGPCADMYVDVYGFPRNGNIPPQNTDTGWIAIPQDDIA